MHTLNNQHECGPSEYTLKMLQPCHKGTLMNIWENFFQNPQHAFLRKGSKAVCPMSHICGMLKKPVITWNLGHRQKFVGHFSPDSSTFRYLERSRWWGRGGIWRRKWECLKAGESNGKLPLRTCLECNVPEPYRSPDWALVPAKLAHGLNATKLHHLWILISEQSPQEPNPLYRLGRIPKQMATPSEQ
jgi:hypothetical protein